MFNVVILMTLRHYTFNGWMDWGSIQCVNIKKSQMTYLKWICVGVSDGLSRGNGGPGIFFTMFNVVVLITLRHCTFNGWMDWGSI